MNSGWISLHRSMQDHWLWEENRKFSKAEAWIDLLMSANHTDAKLSIKGSLLKCSRGETLQSLETLSLRWKWSRETVRRFLKVLESDAMIVYKNETVTSRITICQYDTYQSANGRSETQMRLTRDADETQTSINNNDNKKKEEKRKASATSKVIEPEIDETNEVDEQGTSEASSLERPSWFGLQDVNGYALRKEPKVGTIIRDPNTGTYIEYEK